MAICLAENNEIIGNVDLFDFENEHHRVGVGILIDSQLTFKQHIDELSKNKYQEQLKCYISFGLL